MIATPSHSKIHSTITSTRGIKDTLSKAKIKSEPSVISEIIQPKLKLGASTNSTNSKEEEKLYSLSLEKMIIKPLLKENDLPDIFDLFW